MASIVLVRKLLPHNERGRTEAVARMLRTMRQHDGKFRLVHPLDSSRRVCVCVSAVVLLPARHLPEEAFQLQGHDPFESRVLA